MAAKRRNNDEDEEQNFASGLPAKSILIGFVCVAALGAGIFFWNKYHPVKGQDLKGRITKRAPIADQQVSKVEVKKTQPMPETSAVVGRADSAFHKIITQKNEPDTIVGPADPHPDIGNQPIKRKTLSVTLSNGIPDSQNEPAYKKQPQQTQSITIDNSKPQQAPVTSASKVVAGNNSPVIGGNSAPVISKNVMKPILKTDTVKTAKPKPHAAKSVYAGYTNRLSAEQFEYFVMQYEEVRSKYHINNKKFMIVLTDGSNAQSLLQELRQKMIAAGYTSVGTGMVHNKSLKGLTIEPNNTGAYIKVTLGIFMNNDFYIY